MRIALVLLVGLIFFTDFYKVLYCLLSKFIMLVIDLYMHNLNDRYTLIEINDRYNLIKINDRYTLIEINDG